MLEYNAEIWKLKPLAEMPLAKAEPAAKSAAGVGSK
jgi:hypothetical protein